MKTIEATVQKQNLVITPSVLSVAESVNAYALKITYDAEWADVDTKIITFKGPSGRAYPIPDNGEESGVVIPWEVLRCPGKVYVGVIGYKGSVQKLVTTGIYERNTFVVLPAAFGLSEAITPTPDVYQKIVQTIELMQGEIGDLADLTTEAKNNLVAAINEIAEGGGATGTVKSVNNVEPDASGNVQLGAGDVGAQSALNTAQLAAVNSGINSTKVSQIATNETDIDAIEAKIPSAATSANQLADKDFVNNQVSTNTANYISDNGEPFESVAALEAYSGTVTNNDYAFVEVIESGNTYYDRYKATVTGSTVTWAKEYRINNSSFTSGQWDAINSGITSSGVAKLVDFTGTDGTAAGSTGLVPAPTTGDAGKVLGASGNWETPSGGVKTLTTADYNYPANNPSYVGLWLLEPGFYSIPEGVSWRGPDMTSTANTSTVAMVGQKNNINYTPIVYGHNGRLRGGAGQSSTYSQSINGQGFILSSTDIVDNLKASSSGSDNWKPLSAYQGYLLNNKILDLVLTTSEFNTLWENA